LCEAHQGNHSHYATKNCELCQAQAEIERLREALEQIANPPDPSPFGAPRWVGNPLQEIARAALAGKEDA